jgi:ADP-ribose pyrophosphatase
MTLKVEVLERVERYEGFFGLSTFRLRHTLYGGGWSHEISRELFHRGACVAVLPYDPVRQEVLLIEQFRIGALGQKEPPWLTEIVAGGIEAGETPEDVAFREAGEEAGLALKTLHRIGSFFTSPGGTGERVTLFIGLVEGSLEGGLHGLAEEGEDIRSFTLSLDEANQAVASGCVDSIIPAYAIQWLATHRELFKVPGAMPRI